MLTGASLQCTKVVGSIKKDEVVAAIKSDYMKYGPEFGASINYCRTAGCC